MFSRKPASKLTKWLAPAASAPAWKLKVADTLPFSPLMIGKIASGEKP